MTGPLRAQAVFQALQGVLGLHWVAGHGGGERVLAEGKAATALGGRLDWVRPPPVQVLGPQELRFLEELEAPVRDSLIQRLLQADAVLVCGEQDIALLESAAEAAGTPLWHTPAAPEAALERLAEYQLGLEESTLVHGELLEVFGLGVLVTGASGIGKSELALDLVSRGHRLIADDTTELIRTAPGAIEGICPPALRDFLEVRGLGIVNVRRMFGDSIIKRNKRVRLIVHLMRQETLGLSAESRLQGAREQRTLLGVSIPLLNLPVAPGRHLAVLVECAVRDHIQRLGGYQADQDLMERLQTEMKTPCE